MAKRQLLSVAEFQTTEQTEEKGGSNQNNREARDYQVVLR